MDLVLDWRAATHGIHLALDVVCLRVEHAGYVPRARDVRRLDMRNIFLTSSCEGSPWALPFAIWFDAASNGVFHFYCVSILA